MTAATASANQTPQIVPRKGMRVEFVSKSQPGLTVYGTIKSGQILSDGRIIVLDDNHKPGYTHEWRVPVGVLKPTTKPAPESPAISGTNSHSGQPIYRAGDRVEFDARGETHYGTVKNGNVLKGDRLAVAEDGRTGSWKVPLRMLKPTAKPAPMVIPTAPVFNVGDRVEFNEKGTMHYGTVTKVYSNGEKVKVAEDKTDMVWSGSVRLFNPSKKVLEIPKEPATPADIYGVTGYRTFGMGHEGTIWRAKVLKNGVHVIDALDNATGGPIEYDGAGRSPTQRIANGKEIDQFEKACAEWYRINTGENPHGGEHGALYIEWFLHRKPSGISAKEYLRPTTRASLEEESKKPFSPFRED